MGGRGSRRAKTLLTSPTGSIRTRLLLRKENWTKILSESSFVAKEDARMFLDSVWQILCELSPWMLLGTLIAGLMHVLLPANWLRHSLRGRTGVLKAVLLGVPLPLCSCGVIPTGIGLRKNGASRGASIGFLISTPQTGVDSILVAATFLGWPFAIFKVLAAAVTGLFGGWMTDAIVKESVDEVPEASTVTSTNKLREFFSFSIEILKSIWLWLVIGVLISALITEFIPQSVFIQINEWGIFPALILVLLLSTPLYVCATASVPVAAALVAGGLSPAVALVFLMAGPATNVATISAIFGKFGWRTTAVYLGTIIGGSIAFALLFDWVITTGTVHDAAAHEHVPHWWAQLSAIVLLLLFSWFGFQSLSRLGKKWSRRGNLATDAKLQIPVTGMSCQNCVSKIERSLEPIEGVEQVDVHLEQGNVAVHGTVDRETVVEAIKNAGFMPHG